MQLAFEFPWGLVIVISLAYTEREARIKVCFHLGMILKIKEQFFNLSSPAMINVDFRHFF